MLSNHEKMGELMRVLRSHPTGTRIIIFANTKRMCDQLAYSLMRDFRAAAIHGDKRQQVCCMVGWIHHLARRLAWEGVWVGNGHLVR